MAKETHSIHVDIPEKGDVLLALLDGLLVHGYRVQRISHGKDDGFVLDADHPDILDVDILDHAAPPEGALNAHPNISGKEKATLDKNVSDPTRHLAPDDESPMALKDGTIMNPHQFARPRSFPGLGVLPAFQSDGVVPRFENTILDLDVPA